MNNRTNFSLKMRLIVMNFLQFFTWGAWLISLGGYMMKPAELGGLGFTGLQVGAIYGTMGIASLFMPGLAGIIADKRINAERLLGILHLLGAGLLITTAQVKDYTLMYPLMLLVSMCYMPTIALTNTVAYNAMEKQQMDIVKEFPPIRVWGTVGFILAMWLVDLSGSGRSPMQLYIAAGSAVLLGLYSFTLPQCPPLGLAGKGSGEKKSLISALGLDALVLFKEKQMAIFFIFSVLLGAALQVTNTFGNPFLDSFKSSFADSFAVQHPNVLLSLSQISETLFILAIPFVLGRFGIKRVMLISMLAWVLRFGFFGIGNPGSGFIFLILSMIVYGMAFDFFNISGSLFVERVCSPKIRASAQGLFMIMTNGIGAIIGGFASGWVVDLFTRPTEGTDWQPVWFIFAGYALMVAILFQLLFKYKELAKQVRE
ncbi:nucleoside permease [Porphyromonas crevioricanis]|uniref:nucleoside permease n=1 Tax=Porphyromonas crevioricanis TaxID=393921 RepID=UPI00052DC97F|nr:nucleoside permease [Porphyromonas crevioricanis]KGN90189.1 nucleoside permease [Porphyromonas crevioricanis]